MLGGEDLFFGGALQGGGESFFVEELLHHLGFLRIEGRKMLQELGFAETLDPLTTLNPR